MTSPSERTVREIAIEHPGSVRVFESLGIDYCCGGKRSLQQACERSGVALEKVVELLAQANKEAAPVGVENWAGAGMDVLTAHIVDQHHAYVRREAPRLAGLLEKVVSKHGAAHGELAAIRELFTAMAEELFAHMQKEENILFPYLARMETAARDGRSLPAALFGTVEAPISRLLADHDDAGELTSRMRALAHDYALPPEACPTYRALYQGLEEFERDLHVHVHLENNILFPRALALEQSDAADARQPQPN